MVAPRVLAVGVDRIDQEQTAHLFGFVGGEGHREQAAHRMPDDGRGRAEVCNARCEPLAGVFIVVAEPGVGHAARGAVPARLPRVQPEIAGERFPLRAPRPGAAADPVQE